MIPSTWVSVPTETTKTCASKSYGNFLDWILAGQSLYIQIKAYFQDGL